MSDNYCSTPGCGYPDGKPCIGCGHIVGPTVEHVEVITKQSAERQATIETLRHELLASQALVENLRHTLSLTLPRLKELTRTYKSEISRLFTQDFDEAISRVGQALTTTPQLALKDALKNARVEEIGYISREVFTVGVDWQKAGNQTAANAAAYLHSRIEKRIAELKAL